MACFKNKLLICLSIFVVLLPFYLITFVYADSGYVDYTTIENAVINSSKTIVQNNDYNVIYFPVNSDNQYTVHISHLDSMAPGNYRYGFTSSTNVDFGLILDTYAQIFTETNEISFDLPSGYNGYFCVVSSGANTSFDVTYTSDNMSNAVNGLVDNVGINNIWGIFDISINYIVIAVLVAFGIYIVFRFIRKISKGKEGL